MVEITVEKTLAVGVGDFSGGQFVMSLIFLTRSMWSFRVLFVYHLANIFSNQLYETFIWFLQLI